MPKKYKLTHEVDAADTKEDIALGELRTRLSDLKNVPEDKMLVKWLLARNFDISKAESMYRNSMAYRERMRVGTLRNEFEAPEVLKKYYPGGTIGKDKEGRVIRVELHGKLDLRGMVYSVRQIDLEKYKLCGWENLLDESKGDGITVIADMDGLSMKSLWKPGVQMYTKLLKILEDNYPEMLKRMLIINAPRVFILVYKLVRPLLSEATKQKMQVLGSDYPKTLLKYIDADVLPAYLGGNQTDPDGNPRCTTLIGQGGIVPEEYYLKDMINTENLQTATVARGDRLTLDFKVTKPGSVLRWEFMTDGYDIGFGLYRQEKNAKATIIETDRVRSHLIPEDGSLVCEHVGSYTLVFDNTFSWARGKSVHYHVELIDPADTEDTASDLSKMLTDGLTLDDVMKSKEHGKQ